MKTQFVPKILLFGLSLFFYIPVLHPGIHNLRCDAGGRDPPVRLSREGHHDFRPGAVCRHPLLRSQA